MGRKISARERYATEAAIELIKTTKNQNIKAQMAKLLDGMDARAKARADAHEKQRLARTHMQNVTKLESEISLLKKGP